MGGGLGAAAEGLSGRFADARADPALMVSAGAHLVLVAVAFLGGLLTPDREPELPEEITVQVVSASELAALEAAARAPSPEVVATVPPEEQAPPPAPEARPEPAAAEAPEAPPPDAEPEPPLDPPPTPVEEAPEPEPVPVPEAPPPAPAPSAPPLPAERVAPTPAPPPPPEAEPADVARAAAEPSPEAPPAEEEPAEAPEEAGNVLTTEALPAVEPEEPPIDAPPLEAPPSLAPEASLRPPPRPAPPEPIAAAPSTPAQVDEASSTEVETDSDADAIEAALAEVAEPTPSTAPPVSGSPLTDAEEESLNRSIGPCRNVGPLSLEARRVIVTVYVEFDRAAKPIPGSIEMVGFEEGSEAAARQAYSAHRRAIIMCGTEGYPLPPEKYEAWRQYKLRFPPIEGT